MKLMRKLDLTPIQINPFFKQFPQFQTTIGGCSTLLIGVLSMLAILAFGLDIVTKENPSVMVSMNQVNRPQINNKDVTFAFALLQRGGYNYEEIERYVTVNFTHYHVDMANKEVPTVIKVLNYTSCDKSMEFETNKNGFKDYFFDPSTYNCLKQSEADDGEFDLESKFGNPFFKMIAIDVKYCVNNTENGNHCKSRKQIQEYLGEFFIQLIVSNSYVDNNDYLNPIKRTYESKIIKGSSKSFRQDYYFFKTYEYNSDNGMLMEDIQTTNYFELENTESEIYYNPDTETMYEIFLTISNQRLIYKRTYLKVQKIAADVGGFIKFCTIILNLVVLNYGKLQLYSYLYKNIGDHDDITKRKSTAFKIQQPSFNSLPCKDRNSSQMQALKNNKEESSEVNKINIHQTNKLSKIAEITPEIRIKKSSKLKKELSKEKCFGPLEYLRYLTNSKGSEQINLMRKIEVYFEKVYTIENLLQCIEENKRMKSQLLKNKDEFDIETRKFMISEILNPSD